MKRISTLFGTVKCVLTPAILLLAICRAAAQNEVTLPLYAPQFPCQDFALAQFRQRPAVGVIFRRAACQQLFITVIQMLRQFLDNFDLTFGP